MNATNNNQRQVEHERIAQLAQQIWEREGRQAGHDVEYWLRAERELVGERNHSSKPMPNPAPAKSSPTPITARAGKRHAPRPVQV